MVAALPFSVVKTSGKKGQASARCLSFLAGYVVCPVLMLEEVGSPHPLTLSPPHHFITPSLHLPFSGRARMVLRQGGRKVAGGKMARGDLLQRGFLGALLPGKRAPGAGNTDPAP